MYSCWSPLLVRSVFLVFLPSRVDLNMQQPMFKIYFADENKEISLYWFFLSLAKSLLSQVHFTLIKNVPSHAVRYKHIEGPPSAVLMMGSTSVSRQIKENLPSMNSKGGHRTDINGNNFLKIKGTVKCMLTHCHKQKAVIEQEEKN